MNLHLAEISSQVAPARSLQWSVTAPVGMPRGGKLKVPDNIVLFPLPPYSPELNPMENVWDYLRANKLSTGSGTTTSRSWACAEAWNWLIDDPDRIRSIGTREWATVNV